MKLLPIQNEYYAILYYGKFFRNIFNVQNLRIKYGEKNGNTYLFEL